MVGLFAYIGCFVLLCLSIFQIALIFGAPLGRYAWGGNYTVLPTKLRIASSSSILLYVFFAVVLITKAGIANIIPSSSFTDVAIWIMAAYFCVGVVMNAMSRSTRERNIMTPAALLLAIVFLYVAAR